MRRDGQPESRPARARSGLRPRDPRRLGQALNELEFAASVRHELVTGMSVDVGYFRRWFYGFLVTDNRTVGPADFDRFSISAPTDRGSPTAAARSSRSLEPEPANRTGRRQLRDARRQYGEQSEYWHGVDVNVNARLDDGLLLRGGVSTGRRSPTTASRCGAAGNVAPRHALLSPRRRLERRDPGKMIASYTIPRIDLFVSGLLQSVAGPLVTANYTATNALSRRRSAATSPAAPPMSSSTSSSPAMMYGDR